MNLNTLTRSNASIGNTLESLGRIHGPSVNIAIFQRSVHHLEEELNRLLESQVKIRVAGTLQEIEDALASNFAALGLEGSEVLADIMTLIDGFKSITKAYKYRVFLATVDSNMCRRFHTDINDLRMICTYLGKGTLWVDEEGLDRDLLHAQSQKPEFVQADECIRYSRAGEVLILKGALYPNGEAVIHRSPTIEDLGEKRLLLRIDSFTDTFA